MGNLDEGMGMSRSGEVGGEREKAGLRMASMA